MEHCEVKDQIQVALLAVTSELFGRLWVEFGDHGIPSMNIWEESKAIEVQHEEGVYNIHIRVGESQIEMVWSEEMKYVAGKDGIKSYDFGTATRDELSQAGSLVMMYFAQCMSL
jgi:hypothetical protein